MAMKRMVVPETAQSNIYFGSMSWRAEYDGHTTLIFTNANMRRGGKVVITDVHPGEEIGFNADGPDSKAFKVQPPKDPKYRILWDYGFTKPKRITKWFSTDDEFPGIKAELEFAYPGDSWRNQSGYFTLDWNVRYVTIRDENGRIMVQTACGRLERSNNILDQWYMHPLATLDHVLQWKEEYKKYLKGEN